MTVLSAALAWPAAAQAPAGPSGGDPSSPRVDIFEYDVEGNTLLKTIDIQRALRPYVGPQHPLSDTEAARKALQQAYADRGYQAVSVVLPPQSVTGGLVRIQVVEAKPSQITVTGNRYEPKREITSALPSLKPGVSPDFNAFTQELNALNAHTADLQVTPKLTPGDTPDRVNVELQVKDHPPVHGGIELNNNYSPDTKSLRLQANLAYDDLWSMGHSISAFYDVAPERRTDAEVYVLTYGAPMPGTPIRLTVSGLVSNSNVNEVGGLGVVGKGHSVTFTGTAPLPQMGAFSQSLQAGFAYKDFTDRLTVTGQIDTAPITYFPFSLTYTAGWRGTHDEINGNLGVNFAVRGLGSSASDYDTKRYLALPDFAYLKGQASWQHDLFAGMQLYGEFDGQVASQPLISNEQFSAGGQSSVRGYLVSEGLGDNGVHGTVELRSPPLESYIDATGRVLTSLKILAFTDSARLWLLSPLPGQQADMALTSVGLGLRTGAFGLVHLDLDLAAPLQLNGSTHQGQWFLFRLYSNF